MRRKIKLAILISSFLLIGCSAMNSPQNLRVSQGIDEAQRAVIKAYNNEAWRKAPYLYSKSKAYKEVSYVLASEMDDVGANIFSIRSINYASMSITASFTGSEQPTPLEELNPQRLVGKEGILNLIDLNSLQRDLLFLRDNRGVRCAPVQMGKAEAFYDALIYELNKETPIPSLVLRFYNEANTESKVAKNKVLVAKRNGLECYTGTKQSKRPKLVRKTAQTIKSEPKPKTSKPEIHREPLKIVARIHFDFDRYNIKKEYKPILNEVIKTLKQNPYVELIIEGYTDNIGTKKYNDKLALKRARSVKNYLVKHGIPAEKIKIKGIGKDKYIATNRTPVGRLTNRRVEFILIKRAEKP
jgi:outer membrane protein OmpA-like peptidoglycan-associated protein